MEYHEVVTSFITADQQVLLLRRSEKVGSHRGRWSAVSGYLEGSEQPLTRAVTEIREELGLTANQTRLLRIGETLRAYDEENDTVWIIHPFLFETSSKSVRLDWENVECRWVTTGELHSYPTVPKLRETLDRVQYDLQPIPTALTDVVRRVKQLAEDRIHGATFIGQEALRFLSETSQASDAKDADTLFSHVLLVGLRLRHVQPAMANVWNLTGKLLQTVDQRRAAGASPEELRSLTQKSSVQILEDEAEASEDVARNTANLLPQDGVVLAHSYSSAVLRSLELGFKSGKEFRVYATESYPGMEGKLVAKELIALGVPVTLIADSAVGSIIHEVDLTLMGADSVLNDGTLVHKVGTHDISTVAKRQGTPVYSSSETAKFSVQDFLGERPETTPIFDLTPPELVSSYVTEAGLVAPTEVTERIRRLQKEIYP